MLQAIDIKQILDVGFVIFVVAVCARSLMTSDQSEGRNSRKWIEELTTLQGALKELIGDASAASSELDRNLVRRKRELEILLDKVEKATAAAEEYIETRPAPQQMPPPRPAPKPAARNAVAKTYGKVATPKREEEEFPNESWTMESSSDSEEESLEELVRSSEDRVEIRDTSDEALADSALGRKVEHMLSNQRRAATDESVDPAAYRIAKRLLESGKEIHVVSRKLGMSLNEVRIIDNLVQRERAKREAKQPKAAPPPHVVGRNDRTRPERNRQGLSREVEVLRTDDEEDLENEIAIERETRFIS